MDKIFNPSVRTQSCLESILFVYVNNCFETHCGQNKCCETDEICSSRHYITQFMIK